MLSEVDFKKLFNSQVEMAMASYHVNYNNDAFFAATGPEPVSIQARADWINRSNALLDTAMAICGHPYFRVDQDLMESLRPSERRFLEFFLTEAVPPWLKRTILGSVAQGPSFRQDPQEGWQGWEITAPPVSPVDGNDIHTNNNEIWEVKIRIPNDGQRWDQRSVLMQSLPGQPLSNFKRQAEGFIAVFRPEAVEMRFNKQGSQQGFYYDTLEGIQQNEDLLAQCGDWAREDEIAQSTENYRPY